MAEQRGFFDLDERYAALSAAGDPLAKLGRLIDFEMFRVELERTLARSDGTKGGRPALDAVMMFKVLVLQALYGLRRGAGEVGGVVRKLHYFAMALPHINALWAVHRELPHIGYLAADRLEAI